MSRGAITAVQAATTAVASSAVSRVSWNRRLSFPNQKNSASVHSVASMIQLVRWWVMASAREAHLGRHQQRPRTLDRDCRRPAPAGRRSAMTIAIATVW